jgi:hypothetical protein
VKRVKADLGLRGVLADRLLIAAAHVDRDCLDRLLAVAEQIKERLQCRGVAARRAPHDRAAAMVDDRRQVALAAAVGDLVTADRDEPGEPRFVEMIGDDPGDDPSDGVPRDPQQSGDRFLGHLLGQPRDDVFEVTGVGRAGPGPRDGLITHAAVGAQQPAQLALDDAAVWRRDPGDASA